MNFKLTDPGSIETQTINITNNSQKVQSLEAYLGDWNRNEDGTHTYYDANTQPFSCASWVKLSTNYLEIQPGEFTQLVVTFQAPNNPEELQAMKWAMVFLQGTEPRTKVDGVPGGVQTKINEIIRMGVHLYQTPSHLKLMEAKALALEPNTEEQNVYDLDIENTGYVMLNTRSYLELTNINTGEEFKSEIVECPVFPTGKRLVSLQMPENLPKGQYSMLGILDYGDPYTLEAVEKIIEIK